MIKFVLTLYFCTSATICQWRPGEPEVYMHEKSCSEIGQAYMDIDKQVLKYKCTVWVETPHLKQ
jgi:hypothetical protein